MIEFNKIEQIIKRADYQINMQDLLINGRYHDKIDGWSNCTFTDELKEQLLDLTLTTIGGWKSKREQLKRALSYEKPQHWALSRLVIEERRNQIVMIYIAGQDYPAELSELRRYLKR